MDNKEIADIGIIGMAVMGRNLALNIADHDYTVAVYNREPSLTQQALSASTNRLIATQSLEQLVASLKKPRKILLMIKAGEPVDMVINALKPLLEKSDIVIDGGNSWYEDTQRREQEYAKAGLHFFGVGISGGEEGARFGPAIMPGGDKHAYQHIQPIFEAIAAKTDSGACVTHVGPDGAGHFVKMVHNGIEYADMQYIAEIYHVLANIGKLKPNDLAEVFQQWNKGPLESFLIEITAKIFSVRKQQGDGFLVDQVLDRAGQKGTGLWTAQVALQLAVPIPGISAAIDARVLSSMKQQRLQAAEILTGPSQPCFNGNEQSLIQQAHDALYAAKIAAYAQGLALIKAGSDKYNWSINLSEMARIWKGGCIIRARFLDTIMQAYTRNPQLLNLLIDQSIQESLTKHQSAWRQTVCLAQQYGIPVPALSASLAYFDSYRSARLPQNLTQAQRDAFGAHTYQTIDDPDGAAIHSNWLE